MQTESATAGPPYTATPSIGDAHASGVSWGAVLAGATATAAVALILLMLGLGLGLSSASPWSYHGSVLRNSTISWLLFVQIFASGLGGYLAGRLRVKWARVHNDEVHFRDTAHGLLAWAFATLVTVALLTGGIKTILGDVASSEGTSSHGVGEPGYTAYYADMILRSTQGALEVDSPALRFEVNRIFAVDLAAGTMPPGDVTYLGQIVTKRTGSNQADAQSYVNNIYATALTNIKETVDKARKAAAHSALWMFIALLCGAFVASVMATLGGRQRDHAMIYLPG